MLKETIIKKASNFHKTEQKEPIILFDEFEKSKKITKITGILTSAVRTKPSDNTYMVFLRPINKDEKHSLTECEATKCQSCEIPVVFKIKKYPVFKEDDYNQVLLKPNLSKGDKVLLTGEFSPSKKNHRPSFTCYSYQILNHDE